MIRGALAFQRPVGRVERRRALLFAITVMIFLTIPYVIGALRQGDRSEWTFSGFVLAVEDGNSYLAKMRIGARDGWLFTMVYSNEPHTPSLIFTPYVALGKLAALIRDPGTDSFAQPFTAVLILIFHAARVVCGVLAILATQAFIALFLPRGPLRWVALVFAVLGGGLGWLLVLLGGSGWLGSIPIDFYLPEAYTFLAIYGLPHLALARATLLAGFVLLIRGQGPVRWLLAGFCWLVMGLCVPFYVGVLAALLGAWGLAALIRYRRFPMALFIRCAVAAIIPLPYLLYNTALFATDRVLGAFTAQNRLPSPHPLHYVVGFFVPGVLAAFALRWAWRRGRMWSAYLLLPAWVVAAPLLAYLPVTVQRRLLEGVFVPLCVLATAGLRCVIAPALRYRRRTAQIVWRRAVLLVGALIFPTTLILWAGGISTAANPGSENRAFFRSEPIRNALTVSAALPAGSFALTDYATGNLLPAWTNLRAYVGHGVETLDGDAKRVQAESLLSGSLPAGGAIAALKTLSESGAAPVRAVIFASCQPASAITSRWEGLTLIERSALAADSIAPATGCGAGAIIP